jgi:hypothetical protein
VHKLHHPRSAFDCIPMQELTQLFNVYACVMIIRIRYFTFQTAHYHHRIPRACLPVCS